MARVIPKPAFADLVPTGNGYTLKLPYPPSANRYWRNFRGRMVVSDEARRYKTSAAILARMAGVKEMLTETVSVRIHGYRPRESGDIDNRLKILLDALSGVAWIDDKQVRQVYMVMDYDKANPRVEIEIIEWMSPE